jgi:serine/threonine-protein phosphatase 2B catalytic subunit
MTSFFNFRDECKFIKCIYKFKFLKLFKLFEGLYKFDQEIYELIMDSFDLFPLACTLKYYILNLEK